MKGIWIRVLLVFLLVSGLGLMPLLIGSAAGAGGNLKAGFIYVGPIGDYGWSHAHNAARLIVEETFPWLETVYVESVPEAEVGTYIDRLIQQEKVDVVFTTSFGFMDGTLAAAQRYPEKIFAHCSGFKRAPNMATYMADFYQVYYLNGLMAGALTKSGKVGYVGAFPIPEVKRHINAFTIGVREVNPTAEVHVRWIFEWYNPAAAKEAAEALIKDGADVFAFTEDSPTVVQVAAQNGLPSFGHYSPMFDFAPDYVVSGQIVHWEKFYLDFLAKVYAGMYNTTNLQDVDYWGLLREGAVEAGAKPGMLINPKFEGALKDKKVRICIGIHLPDSTCIGVWIEISVYELVMLRLEQMKDFEMVFDPFTGPIYDRKGNLVIQPGARATYDELLTMEWAVEGVVGPWPGEP
ncbi:MAG: BMP family ABC transporter substrate-binding protein [Candidatus Acetothermia bacterium]|jgi:simple sugar transport system substrate-binding protein|nr:BMP family ABC transporter substrate-binding protein [Candidatus Acetothermia bacterium]MDH7505081.1 BMP family ABC transporter substrate-binding protein [Candidatus Acetothermia bacterium]